MGSNPRSATAFRLPPDLHDQLTAAAAERGVSANWLVIKALEDFLPRLLPADQIVWTRPIQLEVPDEIHEVSGRSGYARVMPDHHDERTELDRDHLGACSDGVTAVRGAVNPGMTVNYGDGRP